MITADGSFLDQSCDRAASLVNPQQLRCGRAWCAERWDVDYFTAHTNAWEYTAAINPSERARRSMEKPCIYPFYLLPYKK
jgi:hypothetical protein